MTRTAPAHPCSAQPPGSRAVTRVLRAAGSTQNPARRANPLHAPRARDTATTAHPPVFRAPNRFARAAGSTQNPARRANRRVRSATGAGESTIEAYGASVVPRP